MKEIILKPENLQKAWDNASDESKRVLEEAAPDFEFEEKIKYEAFKVYGVAGDHRTIYILIYIDNRKYAFAPIGDMDLICLDTYNTPEDAIASVLNLGLDVEPFDNQKDFFTWALKQLS